MKLSNRSAPSKDLDRPGVSLPFRGELWSSVNMHPVQTEVPSTMRQSENEAVIDVKQTSLQKRSPRPSPAMSQPRTPPAVAMRAMPSCLTNEKVMPLQQMASKQLQQPVKKAVIVKNQMSHKSSSPIAPEVPMLPRPSVPVPYRCSVLSCLPNDEHKPLIEAATA